MKKLLLLLLVALPLFAQSKTDHLNDLNRQMWMPFVEGINTDKAELYVGIHADDFYWVAPGSKGRIMNLQQYDDDSRDVMKRRKAEGARGEMEIRFLERNINGEFAAEKCVIRFTMYERDKPPATSYGIAHYFSRKEKGVWRMWLQYGSTEKASAEMFNAAAKLEDVARFA